MHDEGTLSIVREAQGYQVRFAPNDYHGLDRLPVTCPDETALVAWLRTCGLDQWSIQQSCAELRAGRVAVLPIVFAPGEVEVAFPRAPVPWVAAHHAIRALLLPQEG